MSRHVFASSMLFTLLLTPACAESDRTETRSSQAGNSIESPHSKTVSDGEFTQAINQRNLDALSLSSPSAWRDLLTMPEFRNTSEILPADPDSVIIQPVVVRVRNMIETFDETYTVDPPANGKDATTVFQPIFEKIKTANAEKRSVLVIVNPGIYKFGISEQKTSPRNPALLFEAMQRVKFGGRNKSTKPEFIFTNPYGPGFLVKDCKLLEISNIVVDYEYPSTFGKIGYLGKSLGDGKVESREFFDAAVAAGIKAPMELLGSVFSFDSQTKSWFTGTNAYHVTFESGNKPIWDGEKTISDERLAEIPANQEVMLLHKRGGTDVAVKIDGRGNEDIFVRSLKIHSYPQMGIVVSGARGVRIEENSIEPREGRMISGRADGIHIAGAQGDIIIENNLVSGQGDDGLNIHGNAYSVSPLSSDGDLILEGPFDIAVGDRLALLSNGNRPLYSAIVKSVSKHPKGQNVDIDWAACDTSCQKTLFPKSDFQVLPGRFDPKRIGLAFNLTLSSSRYLIKGNTFTNSGARGMIIEAPNGSVLSNNIRNVAGSAIAMTVTNSHFLSGPGPLNVRVVGSKIFNAAFSKVEPRFPLQGAISVMTQSGAFNYPLLQQIVIRDNNVNRVGRAFASVERGKDILFLSNEATNYGLSRATNEDSVRLILKNSVDIKNLDR